MSHAATTLPTVLPGLAKVASTKASLPGMIVGILPALLQPVSNLFPSSHLKF